MFIKKPQFLTKIGPVWNKVIFFSFVLFLIFLSDAILSFWAPNLIEESLGSASKMGLMISFSSLVGLIVDLTLPSVLSGIDTKRLLLMAILTCLVFSLLLIIGVSLPLILIFLLSMTVWGLYYEFLIFAGQLFVAGNVPFKLHSATWAIIGIFKNLAYLLGPLVAAFLLKQNQVFPGFFAMGVVILGLVGLIGINGKKHQHIEIDFKNVNLLSEFKKWRTLFKSIWPVIIISLVLGLVDSTFWTTGAVYTEKLSLQNPLGAFFLSFYQIPSLFIGLIVVKWGIYRGKKKLAETFLLLAGLFMVFFRIDGGLFFILLLVFVSSLFLAFTYPLLEGVYSDVVDRMGKEKKHLIGFSSAAISIAYIVGPVLSGFLTEFVGERQTFSYMGILTITVAIILLFTTPKKLKLPQEEIKSWYIT